MNGKRLIAQAEPMFRTIVRDIHFWIPLIVLIAGLLFLHELR